MFFDILKHIQVNVFPYISETYKKGKKKEETIFSSF